MRIALVVSSIEIGGVETYLRILADSFVDFGFEVVFVETREKGRWAGEFVSLGYKVIQIIPLWHESERQHVLRIGNCLKGFEVAFLNNAPQANPALGLLPRNVLVIPVLHLELPGMIDNALENFPECSQLVVISPFLKESVLGTGRIGKKQISLICNGVEVKKSYPRIGVNMHPQGNLHVGFLGRVDHAHKGVLNIPKIFQLYKGQREKLSFSVVGDGPDMNNLKKELGRTCPWLNIRYHGYQSNNKAKELLASFDVILMPSYFEGLPIALLEAMALGVVPVITKIPGSEDIITTDPRNGFVVESEDFQSFSRTLERLANEPSLRIGISHQAWRTVVQKYNADKMGRQYRELLSSLQLGPLRRDCSGALRTDLLGEFHNFPGIIAVFLRKLRTIYKLIAGE